MVRARFVLTSGILAAFLLGCEATYDEPTSSISPVTGDLDEDVEDAGGEPSTRDAGAELPDDAGDRSDEPDATQTEPEAPDAGTSEDSEGDASTSDPGTSDPGPGTGTPDAGPPGPNPLGDATFTNVYEALGVCRLCHGAGGGNGAFDLTNKQATYQVFLDGPKPGALPHLCSSQGHTLVIPFDPENSLLMQKLENRQTCGDMMPTNQKMVPTYFRDLVRDWILAGAPND